jgi:YHS domain-containing protein
MKRFVTILCALHFMQGTTLAVANERAVSLDKNGVAVRGYDPVAYFIEKRAVKGKADFAVKIDDGSIYYFASAENRAIFIAEPSRYAPQYGGFCAYGAANEVKVQVDPKAFRLIDGKLYLIRSPETATKWSKDSPAFIKKADASWSSLPPN